MKTRRVIVRMLTVLLCFVTTTAVGTVVYWLAKDNSATATWIKIKGQTLYYLNYFTPAIIIDEGTTTPPLGVMVDNEITARPFQKGLSSAATIYEAPTEGGITRFLAIFPGEAYPEKVGPVRSSRPYYLDIVHEYNAVYAHVGGSAQALARLQKEKIFNADQYVLDKYFWRENVGKVSLEHTMFTNGEKMYKLVSEKKWALEEIAPVKDAKDFDAEAIMNGRTETNEIKINFGIYNYNVKYKYDPEKKTYLRRQGGKTHMDSASGEQLAPDTVVVRRVESWSNNDAKETITIKSIGEGKMYIFSRGRVIEGTWNKESVDSPVKYFDENGIEISLNNAGLVWVEILPKQNSFSYTSVQPEQYKTTLE